MTGFVSASILVSLYIPALASEGSDISVDDCRTDSNNNLIVSGTNNGDEDMMLGMFVSHRESGDIVIADQITALSDEKFYFGGINFKTDGSMKTGMYDIEISDGKAIDIKREIYIASDEQLKNIFTAISAPNADIAQVLKTTEDNVTYGDMLNVDMESFENLSETSLFSEIISENSGRFELDEDTSTGEIADTVAFFKNVFSDALALQEYNNAKNSDALKNWFLKYQTVAYGITGYDERYDFSGGDNAGINDIRTDMEKADMSDSEERITKLYKKLLGFEKLSASGFKSTEDESKADNVIDYLLWKLNRDYIDATLLTAVKVMPTAYSRDMVLENEEYIPFDREYYNKLSTNAKKYAAIEGVMGKEYSDIEALCKQIKEACKAAYDPSESDSKKPSGGSSGGGGGAVIGGIGNSVIGNITKNEGNNEVTSKDESKSEYFNDLIGVDWAIEPIDSLYKAGAINGFGNGSFKPNKNITRAEFVKMIVAAFGLESDNVDCDFYDVGESDWFYKYVAIASELGIVNGVGDGGFAPGRFITREELSTILFRTAFKAGYILEKSGQIFADDGNISDYAKEAVLKLNGEGIINGVGGGNFLPKAYGTRAQAAKMIYYTLRLNKKDEEVKDYGDELDITAFSAPTIAEFYNNKQAAVTLTFDDGDYASAEYYDSLMAENNIHGTAMLVTDWIKDEEISKWKALLSNGNIDIGNHSASHAIRYNDAGVTAEVLEADITGAYNKLKELFPEQKIMTFASPWTQISELSQAEVKKNHFANRTSGDGLIASNPDDGVMLKLPAYVVMYEDAVSTLTSKVDQAIEGNNWLVYMMHGVGDSGYNIHKNTCKSFFEYIGSKESQVWAGSLTEVVQYIYEKKNAKVSVNWIKENGMSLSLTDTLDNELFDFPVTVIVDIPDEWGSVSAVGNGGAKTTESFERDANKFAVVNIIPDRGEVVLENNG